LPSDVIKCTKSYFGWAPHHTLLGELTDPLARFKGPTSKGGSGQQGRERGRGSPPL